MASQLVPSATALAHKPGREVPHFYYIIDPEERALLGWLACILVHFVTEYKPDIVFFLDKSGRPLQHLFRKAWRECQADHEVAADQFPDQVGFLHIGRGQERQRILTSPDITQLAGYYRKKLGRSPERILIVDEILGSGETMALAFDVVTAMFPGVTPKGFFFQDSTPGNELFVKPSGNRQATWKLSLDNHLAYGLQGVTDTVDWERKSYRDLLAFRPSLRSDWAQQLCYMEGECAMDFGIKLRLAHPCICETLEKICGVLAKYPQEMPQRRAIVYSHWALEAILHGLPTIRRGEQEWKPVHETLDDDVRKVTRGQVAWLRVAACYLNKLMCRLQDLETFVLPQSGELRELQYQLESQMSIMLEVAAAASEWDLSRQFDLHGLAALKMEVYRLRQELDACVDFYRHYRQQNRPALPAPSQPLPSR